MINVTQSFLPPLEEYSNILEKAWNKKWITNRGELLLELEQKLSNRFCLNNFFITTNGTLPLQIALKALGVTKEVITTPFSYVATTSSIIWEGCIPVFCDIDPDTLNINVNKIESLITDETEAILATHVFGNPCDIERINIIAEKYRLKVIYDAAHCFNVRYKEKSVFSYGDISTTSFHATKLFHTGEGGALFANSKELFEKTYYHHNFGHDGPSKYHGLGINAKASEMQAAMGLAVLPYIDKIIGNRKRLSLIYEQELSDVKSIRFQKFKDGATKNYSYMPIIFRSELVLLEVIEKLNSQKVFPRRYFYPSLNKLPYIITNNVFPEAESISKRILCLPLYYELTEEIVIDICGIIKKVIS